MEDAEELLGEDPPKEKEQTPEVSSTEEVVIEPSPTDTTMEVDFEVDQNGDKSPVQLGTEIRDIVGEIIGGVIENGDKSPVNPEAEIEVIDLSPNGDKSPEIKIVEEVVNGDKSPEVEPDEIEILEDFGTVFFKEHINPLPPTNSKVQQQANTIF